MTPNRLLSEVFRRADQLGHMLSPESHPAYSANLLTMMSRWMVWYPTDFRDESAMTRSRQLAKLIVEWQPQCETRVTHLHQTLNTHLLAIERHEKHLEKLAKLAGNSCQISDLLQMNYSATTFAQVICAKGQKILEFQGSRVSANFCDAIGRQSSAVHALCLNHLAVSTW